MGTDTPAWQVDTANWETCLNETECIKLIGSIETVLDKLGLELPNKGKNNYGAEVTTLAGALNRFGHNAELWSTTYGNGQEILQKHLTFTLMVPGGRASRVRDAVNLMSQRDVLPVLPGQPVQSLLLRQIIGPLVRFPNQKAERVVTALRGWDSYIVPVIRKHIALPAAELRKIVMESVVGFGEKAASHFMRNTGLMRGRSALPIIDTHIHKALEVYDLPHKGYPDAECSFTALATKTGIPPLLLDAVLWCAYAKNWDVTRSDFDNFGYTTVINNQ